MGGFPLDVKHFFANIDLSLTYGKAVAGKISIDEEYYQALSPAATAGARSSGLSPEDLLSNRLGHIYSEHAPKDGSLVASLKTFFAEADTLFRTNKLPGGEYLKKDAVDDLRAMILEHHGTDDFRDFQADKKIYTRKNAQERIKKIRAKHKDSAYGKYIRNVYGLKDGLPRDYYENSNVARLYAHPWKDKKYISIPMGTKMQSVPGSSLPILDRRKVSIYDGKHKGKEGWIVKKQLKRFTQKWHDDQDKPR